jgi:predicted nucleic acid-binding protein
MQVFDTSSIVYAWDNYPIDQFPSLWEWLAVQINTGEIAFSEVALEELITVSPDCDEWITGIGPRSLPVTDAVVQFSILIKDTLQIGEKWGGGVGENDLFIIATACIANVPVVTNENTQPQLPKLLANFKMPAVCALAGVRVPCCDFLAYIKASGAVFS